MEEDYFPILIKKTFRSPSSWFARCSQQISIESTILIHHSTVTTKHDKQSKHHSRWEIWEETWKDHRRFVLVSRALFYSFEKIFHQKFIRYILPQSIIRAYFSSFGIKMLTIRLPNETWNRRILKFLMIFIRQNERKIGKLAFSSPRMWQTNNQHTSLFTVWCVYIQNHVTSSLLMKQNKHHIFHIR